MPFLKQLSQHSLQIIQRPPKHPKCGRPFFTMDLQGTQYSGTKGQLALWLPSDRWPRLWKGSCSQCRVERRRSMEYEDSPQSCLVLQPLLDQTPPHQSRQSFALNFSRVPSMLLVESWWHDEGEKKEAGQREEGCVLSAAAIRIPSERFSGGSAVTPCFSSISSADVFPASLPPAGQAQSLPAGLPGW